MDAIQIPNRIRLIMASNENWVVPAAVDDRRFMVLDVSDNHQKDHQYFAAIQNEMDNGGREALLDYLMKYDLSTVNLRDIPQTTALLEQKLRSLNPVYKFWYECLQNGSIESENSGWPKQIPTKQVYNEYREFTKNLGNRRTVTDSEFGIELRKICPQVDKTRIKSKYDFTRKVHYVFPSLKECRKMFESYIGMEIEWNMMEDDDDILGMDSRTENFGIEADYSMYSDDPSEDELPYFDFGDDSEFENLNFDSNDKEIYDDFTMGSQN